MVFAADDNSSAPSSAGYCILSAGTTPEFTQAIPYVASPTFVQRLRTRQTTRVWIEDVTLCAFAFNMLSSQYGHNVKLRATLFRLPYNTRAGANVGDLVNRGQLFAAMYGFDAITTQQTTSPQKCYHWPYYNMQKGDPLFMGNRSVKLQWSAGRFRPRIAGVFNPPGPVVGATMDDAIMASEHTNPGESAKFVRWKWRVRRWFEFPEEDMSQNAMAMTPLFLAFQCQTNPLFPAGQSVVTLSQIQTFIRFRELTSSV